MGLLAHSRPPYCWGHRSRCDDVLRDLRGCPPYNPSLRFRNQAAALHVHSILPAGMGLGILFASLAFAIQASARPGHMAIAVAMFSFFRAFGQGIGVAVGGVIFQNQIYKNLLRYPELAANASAYSKDAAGLV